MLESSIEVSTSIDSAMMFSRLSDMEGAVRSLCRAVESISQAMLVLARVSDDGESP